MHHDAWWSLRTSCLREYACISSLFNFDRHWYWWLAVITCYLLCTCLQCQCLEEICEKPVATGPSKKESRSLTSTMPERAFEELKSLTLKLPHQNGEMVSAACQQYNGHPVIHGIPFPLKAPTVANSLEIRRARKKIATSFSSFSWVLLLVLELIVFWPLLNLALGGQDQTP